MAHPLERDSYRNDVDAAMAPMREALDQLTADSLAEARSSLPGLVDLLTAVLKGLNRHAPSHIGDLEEQRLRLPFGFSIHPPAYIGRPLHENRLLVELLVEVTQRLHQALDWLVESIAQDMAGSTLPPLPPAAAQDAALTRRVLSRLLDGLKERDPYAYTEGVEVTVATLDIRREGPNREYAHIDYFRPPGPGGPEILVTEVLGFPPEPKELPVLATLKARRRQLDFLDLIVRMSERIAAAGGTLALGPGFPHSDTDLRSLLETVYLALGGGHAAADDGALTVLRAYYDGFTLSSINNVPDQGLGPKAASYLNASFPRGLTGQRIHDCGVYAVRTAFLMGGILEDLGLHVYFGSMPLHLGVIAVAAEGLEDEPGKDGDVDALRGPGFFIAHNQGLLLAGREDAEKALQGWPAQPGVSCAGPADALQFAGEAFTAGFWGRQILDTPFRLTAVKRTTRPGDVWASYLTTQGRTLFTTAPTTFPLAVAYFGFMREYKRFFNSTVREFWNVEAPEIVELHRHVPVDLGMALVGGRFPPRVRRKALVRHLLPHFREVEALFLSLADDPTVIPGVQGLRTYWSVISTSLCRSPSPLSAGVRVACAERAGGVRGVNLTQGSGGCWDMSREAPPWKDSPPSPLLQGWWHQVENYLQELETSRALRDPPSPFEEPLPMLT